MLTTSDMSYWMLVEAGIIPSRGRNPNELSESMQQALDGYYSYSHHDLEILMNCSPLSRIDEVRSDFHPLS